MSEGTVNADQTKLMQDALQAAVTRMNAGSAEPQVGQGDVFGALVSVLPKLLHGGETGDEMLEKLDSLQKEDLGSLRAQVQILRKQCFRVLKCQEHLLVRVKEIQRQQTVVAGAVLDVAQQMARITVIGDIPPSDYEYERYVPPARESHPPAREAYRASDSGAGGNGHGRKPARPTSRARA